MQSLFWHGSPDSCRRCNRSCESKLVRQRRGLPCQVRVSSGWTRAHAHWSLPHTPQVCVRSADCIRSKCLIKSRNCVRIQLRESVSFAQLKAGCSLLLLEAAGWYCATGTHGTSLRCVPRKSLPAPCVRCHPRPALAETRPSPSCLLLTGRVRSACVAMPMMGGDGKKSARQPRRQAG